MERRRYFLKNNRKTALFALKRTHRLYFEILRLKVLLLTEFVLQIQSIRLQWRTERVVHNDDD